jgi:hypothetical protein
VTAPSTGAANDPVFLAAVALIGRTGAKELTIGFSDEHVPAVWFAAVKYRRAYEAAGAMDPRQAVLRLLDQLLDGGACTHCGKPTGVTVKQGTQPLSALICWYQYDPEMKTFRRDCE